MKKVLLILLCLLLSACGKADDAQDMSLTASVSDEGLKTSSGRPIEEYLADLGREGITVRGQVYEFDKYYKGDPEYTKARNEHQVWANPGYVLVLSSPVTYDGQTIDVCISGWDGVIHEDIQDRALAAGETEFFGYFEPQPYVSNDSTDITEEVMGSPVYTFSILECDNGAAASEGTLNTAEQSGPETDTVIGGIGFTILDSSTVKASINDPRILAYAMDMGEVQLKLFPDEDSRERREGAIAFKIQFNEIDGQMWCNVYPQTCTIEPIEGSSGSSILDEEITGSDGAPICGAATVDDTMLTFVVQYSGLESIVENNRYYATYVDYQEYTRGEIDSVGRRQMVEPDLSGTSLAGKVDLSYFNDLYPEYFVVEEDFDPYKSYSGHKFVDHVDTYRGNAVDLLWMPTSNSDISKKALLIGSVDEFGIANYYMAVVYDSQRDLIRDYMCDGTINCTAEFGIHDPDPDLITDELLNIFIPENSGNIFGTWSYSVGDNVLYWHYIPDFDLHYKSYEGFNIPEVEFSNAGLNGSTDWLNIKLGEIIHEVIDTGKAEGSFAYDYQWDDMSADAVNYRNATSNVNYKGYYHKADQTGDAADPGLALSEEDNAVIRAETLRIRDEILQAQAADIEAKKNAEATIDPACDCFMYDDDSTDFLLKDLDTDVLVRGGAYEIDFEGYTIRVTAASIDAPLCEIGKYNGAIFEKICDASCYRNLDAGPNYITVNANISTIEGVGWKQVRDMEFYELKDGKTRTKIDQPIGINRWYQ